MGQWPGLLAPVIAAIACCLLLPSVMRSCRGPVPDPYLTPSDRDEEDLQKLAQAGSDLHRYYALGDAARVQLKRGNLEEAKALADELLLTAASMPPDWNYGNAVHDAHIALGYLALERDDAEAAAKHLLAAGQTPGSPQLDTFGPNMSLARALLQRGVRAPVLEYLELCRRFWKHAGKRLDQWKKAVEVDQMPDFGIALGNGT